MATLSEFFSTFSTIVVAGTHNFLILLLINVIVLLFLIIWIVRLQSRIGRLLVGKNTKSLEESMTAIVKEIKDFGSFTEEMQQYLTTVEARLKKSIQSIETVRYNPFKGTGSGGNQSFSSAFLNERGDGVVLTSMYARDRMSMFAKPIKNFTSEFELSEEEVEALTACQQKIIPTK